MDFFQKNNFPKHPDLKLERRIETDTSVTLLIKYKGCIIGCGVFDRGYVPTENDISRLPWHRLIYDKMESIQFPLIYTYGFVFILGADYIYYRSTFGEAEKGIKIDSVEKLDHQINFVLKEIDADQERRKQTSVNLPTGGALIDSEKHKKMIERLENLAEETRIDNNPTFNLTLMEMDIQNLKDALNASIVTHYNFTFEYYCEQYFPKQY
jgi:hypothetical protein